MMDERVRAIECLYRDRFSGYCDALATMTRDYESARDAVQEAFARALRERRRLRSEASLAPWIWTIALRVALASASRRRDVPLSPDEPTLPEPERDPALAAAIRALPPRRRLIVFLRYFAGFSYAEIAEACGVREGTVAATLAQAHDALLAQLQEVSECTS
ncbi:MAG: RNA polymerase sigma factor [Thermoleophilia bacterium]|nr:RNA polymerase sigma factor [Thermoleophilia bacterium]